MATTDTAPELLVRIKKVVPDYELQLASFEATQAQIQQSYPEYEVYQGTAFPTPIHRSWVWPNSYTSQWVAFFHKEKKELGMLFVLKSKLGLEEPRPFFDSF